MTLGTWAFWEKPIQGTIQVAFIAVLGWAVLKVKPYIQRKFQEDVQNEFRIVLRVLFVCMDAMSAYGMVCSGARVMIHYGWLRFGDWWMLAYFAGIRIQWCYFIYSLDRRKRIAQLIASVSSRQVTRTIANDYAFGSTFRKSGVYAMFSTAFWIWTGLYLALLIR